MEIAFSLNICLLFKKSIFLMLICMSANYGRKDGQSIITLTVITSDYASDNRVSCCQHSLQELHLVNLEKFCLLARCFLFLINRAKMGKFVQIIKVIHYSGTFLFVFLITCKALHASHILIGDPNCGTLA